MDVLAPFALAQLTLVLVLAYSGVAKLRDVNSTVSVVTLLRLPRFIRHRAFAYALPVGELLLAAALFLPLHWAYAVATFATLALFIAYWVIVARAMRFDPRPSCGCFGRIGDQSISGRTLWRNSALLLLALLSCAFPLSNRTLVGQLAANGLTGLVWILVAAAATAVVVLILRRGAEPAPRVQQAPPMASAEASEDEDYVAMPMPDATLQLSSGSMTTLRELARSAPQILILVNCMCSPTHEAVRRLPQWQAAVPTVGLNIAASVEHDLFERGTGYESGLYDHGGTVWRALNIASSPAAVLLGVDGTVSGGPVYGVDGIEEFVSDVAGVLEELRDEAASEQSAMGSV